MKKQEILQKICSNNRYQSVKKVYDQLCNKYGPITIGGGALVDCYFDKDFYDIDCFISVKDLKKEWINHCKVASAKNHLIDVIRDNIDGFDIDVVVIDYSVSTHVNRFDQRFKQIWLNQKGLHITNCAVKDINNNIVKIGVANGPTIYYRLIRSAKKYNMKIDKVDLFLLKNLLSSLKYVYIADKYIDMHKNFVPYPHADELLARAVFRYTRLYWNKKAIIIPKWTIFRLFISRYMRRRYKNLYK